MPPRRSALGALVLAALLPASAAAQTRDTVRVVLTAGRAAVEQRLAPEGGRVRAVAMRIEGQSLDVQEVVREGESLLDAALTPGERVYVFEVESGAPILIRYALTGLVRQIPLFVRGGGAELTVVHEVEEPYLIRLEGTPDVLGGLDLATSLPRLEVAGDGVLEARLSSVPALLRLSSSGLVGFARIADLAAVALIILGVVWAWRTARLEPSSAMEPGSGTPGTPGSGPGPGTPGAGEPGREG